MPSELTFTTSHLVRLRYMAKTEVKLDKAESPPRKACSIVGELSLKWRGFTRKLLIDETRMKA